MEYNPTSQEKFGENPLGNPLVLIARGLRVLRRGDIIHPFIRLLHESYCILQIRHAEAVRAFVGNKIKSPMSTKPFEKKPGLPGAGDVTQDPEMQLA